MGDEKGWFLGVTDLVGWLKENDWSSHPERLERVIKAISLSSMKDSLKTLNVYKWNMGVKEVEQMLEKYKLDNVQVTDAYEDPLDE